ncbi:MAG: hypothetical protein QGF15_00085, partial [Alteromonas macleodii]|nr:hypothetical protein [Alteromonas macleodii]
LKCVWHGSLDIDDNYIETTGDLLINVPSTNGDVIAFTTSENEIYFGDLTSTELNGSTSFKIQGKNVTRNITINRFSGEITQSLSFEDSKPLVHFGKCQKRLF